MNVKTNSCPLESVEQQRVISWADWSHTGQGLRIGDLLFAVPNGGSRRKVGRVSLEALRMRKEGVRAGVPDLMLAIPNRSYHGLFIEMKRRRKSLSRVSAEQSRWHERLSSQGYLVQIAYGADEAIKAYLQL